MSLQHLRARRLGIGGLAIALGLTAAMAAPAMAAPPTGPPIAPLHATGSAAEIPGRYLVVLKRPDEGGPSLATADALAGPRSVVRTHGGDVRREFSAAVRGLSADLPSGAVEAVRRDPAVAYVQADRLHRQPMQTGTSRADAPWHVDRIDQRALPLDRTYTGPNDASGVNVYVLDSGVRATHAEFEGRATGVYSSIADGNGTNDCANHGTFVSSHVAGKIYGAAKKANIKAVRILRCDNSASTEEILDGMNWTAANVPARSVVNMSIQSNNGTTDQVLDDAAKSMIDRGLLLVLITGNFNKGDCKNSPKDPRAITIGASTVTDSRNTGSNASSYGPCTTAFAPGANVTGAGKDSDSAVLTGWSGTSFAAPLVAATVAMAVKANPNLTMAQAKDLIITTSTKDVLSNVGAGSPNRLLFVGTSTPSQNPTVTNPGAQTTTVNTSVALQIQATDPQGDPLTYNATGLPSGLAIDAATGKITGSPTSTGSSNVTVTAKDPGGNPGSTAFTWTVSPQSGCTPAQLIGNPSFESGTAPWTGNVGTIGQFREHPARTGTRIAWLNGNGRANTERIAQNVAIPAGCTATLTFHLHITTAETGTRVYDRMTVTVAGTSVATYTNVDARTGYVATTVDVSRFAGRTVALQFSGTEDQSLQTSFIVDDVTIATR